jgi:hypothetical protein
MVIETRQIFYESLKFPSEDWMKVIVLGVWLMLPAIGFIYNFTLISPILLCLGVFPLGYLYRILRSFMEGSDALPSFDDWRSLASDGFKVALVTIMYLIPPILVSFLSLVIQGSFNLVFNSTFTLLGFLTGAPTGLIVLVLVGLFGMIGMANMALYNGEISAAFRFGEILERISLITWKNYLVWYILMMVIGLIAVVTSYLTLMIFIGILLVPLLIIPYFALFITRSLCLIFASSEIIHES